MEEEKEKKLKELLEEIHQATVGDVPIKKDKAKMNVGWFEGLVGVIAGGFIFTLLWLIWTVTYAFIFGLLAVVLTIFIMARLNDGQWRLPWKVRFLGKRKKRKGYCVFMNIGLNRAITFEKAQIEEGVAVVNGVPHPVSPDDILIWKNKIPIIIQPQWSERPFSVREHVEQTMQKQEGTMGWEYIINYILKTQIKAKKSVPGILIIVGIIAIIGLGYYAYKQGVFS